MTKRALLTACMCAGCGRIGFDAPLDLAVLQLAAPPEPLADFPLLVILDSSRAEVAGLSSDAGELRFVGEDGVVLAHEIETGHRSCTPGRDLLITYR